jgi:hypothetical protein
MVTLASNLLVRTFLTAARVDKITHRVSHVEPANEKLKVICVIQDFGVLVDFPKASHVSIDTNYHCQVMAEIRQFILHIFGNVTHQESGGFLASRLAVSDQFIHKLECGTASVISG